MQVITEEGMVPIKAWVGRIENEDGSTRPDIEDLALIQAKNLAALPFISRHGVALMPDVHAGKGSTIGSVIATEKAIIPAAVGVDLGCGMIATRLSLKAKDLPDSLSEIRSRIESYVPLGAGGKHAEKHVHAERFINHLPPMPGCIPDELGGKDAVLQKAMPQLGTLGSGNHFIEICLDENQDVWVMLHSGSRGIGNMIGSKYIEKAKRRMEQHFIHLPDGDLAYLPEDTDDFRAYMEAVEWAQDYAAENRRVMLMATLKAMREVIPLEFSITMEAVNCHHNYVARESHFGRNMWVTRKGAIRAREGDLGIIPGSMGQRSYIVRGKGNLASYCSCSHGAGRSMSRAEARRRFSLSDLVAQTEGVECRKDNAVIDEIPGAYKDIDVVMSHQQDLVEVLHTLKQVMCVKGA